MLYLFCCKNTSKQFIIIIKRVTQVEQFLTFWGKSCEIIHFHLFFQSQYTPRDERRQFAGLISSFWYILVALHIIWSKKGFMLFTDSVSSILRESWLFFSLGRFFLLKINLDNKFESGILTKSYVWRPPEFIWIQTPNFIKSPFLI